MRNKKKDIVLGSLIWISAAITVAVLVGVIGYILINGLPHMTWNFLTTTYSAAKSGSKGILPMIINTLYVIVISLLLGTPVGIGSAIYLTQYAKQGKLVSAIRFATEVLSGIPSILFGLFGYAVFVVLFQLKLSLISGSLTMMICILPTIVRTTEEALLAVPLSYKEGAMALGTGKLRVTLGMILPCAMPGVLTGIILAMGRIVGETAALLFTVGVSGNAMPKGSNIFDALFGHIFEQGNTLALHLYNSAMNGKDPVSVPFATASALLIMVFALNRLAGFLSRRFKK
ncbi:MAG: phosphate ABC transporter permease PstA [Eubacteriales bacterium]